LNFAALGEELLNVSNEVTFFVISQMRGEVEHKAFLLLMLASTVIVFQVRKGFLGMA